MKKKKFKFRVQLCVQELNSVPLVSGVLFTKLRLEDGSKYCDYTPRMEVKNHCVRWAKEFEFVSKVTASSETGVLESVTCRLSIRKEVKGGRSHQKLGFVDLNLAQYAGQGRVVKNCILQGYDDRHRLDNSTVRVHLLMTLLRGDPLFKVPTPDIPETANQIPLSESLTLINKGDNSSNEDATAGSPSTSSGFDSLPRIPMACPPTSSEKYVEVNHSRNSSTVSDMSKNSVGYGTGGRSGHMRNTSSDYTHARNASSGSNKILLTNLRKNGQNDRTERIDSTRVDTDCLVTELLDGVTLDDSQEAKGLQLYIGKDGTASVTGHTNISAQ